MENLIEDTGATPDEIEKVGKKKQTTFRATIKKLLLSDESTEKVALGMAIGIFISFSPFIGTHTWSALAISFLFGASRVAALVGTLFNNPITMPIFFFIEVKLGGFLLGLSLKLPDEVWTNMSEFLAFGKEVALSIIVGFVVIGIIASIIAYFVTYRIVIKFRSRRGVDQDT